jgi:LmbE family N-acetylglucosaminyl deacetylase
MYEFLKNKKIMIVVAHPDDELLGLGGTLNKLIKEYSVVTHLIILGEGITSRSDSRDVKHWEKELEIHQSNIKKAQTAIGYKTISLYDFPDNRFDSVDLLDLVKAIEKEKKEFQPSVIFTHHGGDLNIDHQKTFEAVMTACRPMESEVVKTIITFETPSGTEWRASSDPKHFLPNLYFQISNQNLEAKITAMQSYEFESRPYPHPRSPEALRIYAQKNGINVGVPFAEAFCLIRQIN